jgi:hypothetical protein
MFTFIYSRILFLSLHVDISKMKYDMKKYFKMHLFVFLIITYGCVNLKPNVFHINHEEFPSKYNIMAENFPYLKKVFNVNFSPRLYLSMPLRELGYYSDFERREEKDSIQSTQKYYKTISDYFYGPIVSIADSQCVKVEQINLVFENERLVAAELTLCMSYGWDILRNNPAIIKNLGEPAISGYESEYSSPLYIWTVGNKKFEWDDSFNRYDDQQLIILEANYTGSGRFRIYLIKRKLLYSEFFYDLDLIYSLFR